VFEKEILKAVYFILNTFFRDGFEIL